jgi:hypothetical protein
VRIAVEHPGKIHAVVDLAGEFRNGGIVGKIFRGGQGARKQECCIDGRHFAVPFALAGGDIHPVKEPAMLLGGFGREEFQGGADTRSSLVARDPAVFGADTDCREPEAGGCEAGDVAAGAFGAASLGTGSIEHQAGGGIGFVPEIEDTTAFQVFEQSAVLR